MPFWKRAEQLGLTLPSELCKNNPKFFEGTQCQKLSGTVLLQSVLNQCRQLAEGRFADKARPHLAVILPGNNPASEVYVSHKQKRFAEAGFASTLHHLPESECTPEVLGKLIDTLNRDPDVHGVLLQLPLPGNQDATSLLDRISPIKDVDGFHVRNTGCLASGRYDGLLPCTPFGIMALLQAYGISLMGENVTVVGRSNIVGKPTALMALNARASVTVVHKASREVFEHTRQADVLVAAAGVRHLIVPDSVKEGAVVVDVGIHRDENGKLAGDVHPDVRSKARAITPVPGGVGPMTIAMLCVNTALACWASNTDLAQRQV